MVPVTLRDTRVGLHIPSGHSTLSHRKGAIGQWSRWIGGAALALALASPLAPTTTSAEINEGDTIGHEVIPVEGTAPTAPLPTAPWGPGGYTGGGSGSPSGPSGGVGGGSQGSTTELSTAERRLKGAKGDCQVQGGKWGRSVFKDYDTNVAFAGYSCTVRYPNGKYTWWYYDSEGHLNQKCEGDLDVSRCEAP